MKKTVKTVKQIIEEQRQGNRCIVCHKKFKRRTQQKRLTCDEPYHGNLIVLKKERFWNDSVTLTLWDGESYHDTHKPFCGKDCAYKYAQFKIKTKGIDTVTTVRLVDTYSRTYEVIAK